MIIRKKDGTPRTSARAYNYYVDLRKVNMATRFDCYPLSRIDESLDALGGAKFMSTCTLDNSIAFWSILLQPEDRDKTTFGTRSHGQLRFKRMPFGLTNATATYARALSFVLRGCCGKSAWPTATTPCYGEKTLVNTWAHCTPYSSATLCTM